MDREENIEKKLPQTERDQRPVTPPAPSAPQNSAPTSDDDGDYQYTDWASI